MIDYFRAIVLVSLFASPHFSIGNTLWDGYEKIRAVKSSTPGKYLACENIEATIVFNKICLVLGKENKPAGNPREFTLQELADNYFQKKYRRKVVAVGILPIYYGSTEAVEDNDQIVIAYKEIERTLNQAK